MSEHIQGIKAVLFDLDDTLVGTIKAKWAQHHQIARAHYGIELTDVKIAQHWGEPLTRLVCALYDTDDADRAMAYVQATHLDFPKELFADTIPTLRRLKDHGILTGIITATTRMSLDHDLASHKVSPELVDYKQTEDDTPHHKPDPRVFEPALAWLKVRGILTREVLYVGDGLHDMKAAVGAGFNFLGVETGLVTAEQFTAANTKSVPGIAHLVPEQ